MPTRAEIQKEINERRSQCQDVIRRQYLAEVAKVTGRDVILYSSAWTSSKKHDKLPSSLFMLATEDVQGFMAAVSGLQKRELDLIIHSPGGSLEAADQIVQYLRGKYDHIRAVIPHNAMSAATMLACACDEIVMGRQSAIGPIDPQIGWSTPSGGFTSAAQSLLDELQTARTDVSRDPKLAPIWATRLKDYPPGIFETCKTTMELSEQKVASWLERYMFKSDADGADKAAVIAKWLASASQHKSHGRPIGFDLCQAEGLKVTRLEDNQEFQDAVLSVFHATAVTFEITQCIKIIENHVAPGYYLVVSKEK